MLAVFEHFTIDNTYGLLGMDVGKWAVVVPTFGVKDVTLWNRWEVTRHAVSVLAAYTPASLWRLIFGQVSLVSAAESSGMLLT